MKIDKSKAEPVDWLTAGISPKKLEQEEKKTIKRAERYKNLVRKRYLRARQKIRKADIRPCPRCNGGRYGIRVSSDDKGFAKNYYLGCDVCHFCGEIRRTLNGAIKAWNKETRK